MALAGLDRGAEALVGERRREADVDDREVGLVAADDPQQALAVLGLGDDVDVVLAQQRDDALAQQREVLGDHDPHGSSAWMVVPRPAGSRPSSVPSSASTRWRRPVSPLPARVGAARALSETSTTSSRPRLERTSAGAPVRVLGHVGQRLGDDEVGRGLDHRRRAVARRSRSTARGSPRAGRAPRPRRRGRGRRAPAARSRGRGRAARRSRRSPRRAPGARARRPRAGRRAAPRPGRAAC